MGWAGHVAHMGGMRTSHKILVGKPEGKRPLARPRRRLENNIKTDFKEVWLYGVHWMHLDQEGNQHRAVVNTVMNLRVP
jgi:hypothetical protein